MKRAIAGLATALVLVAVVVGCGSNSPTGLRIQDVQDLREAVEDTGFVCTSWRVLPDVVNAEERAECTEQVVLSTHENSAQARNSVRELESILDDYGFPSIHLVGRNWTINCGEDQDLCYELKDELGGEVQSSS